MLCWTWGWVTGFELCAGLRSQAAGLEIYANALADKVSSLQMIKVNISDCDFEQFA
jgi:hypothetical protein